MKTINDIIEALDLKKAYDEINTRHEISWAYTSDLLSDVMGNSKEKNVLITMQTHKNVAAVASLKDLSGIIIVNGNTANEDLVESCKEEDIPLLLTTKSAFDISGELFILLKE